MLVFAAQAISAATAMIAAVNTMRRMRTERRPVMQITDARDVIMQTVERELYAQAIKQARGNLTKAAKWLGISRVTMREKLSAFGLRSEHQSVGSSPYGFRSSGEGEPPALS